MLWSRSLHLNLTFRRVPGPLFRHRVTHAHTHTHTHKHIVSSNGIFTKYTKRFLRFRLTSVHVYRVLPFSAPSPHPIISTCVAAVLIVYFFPFLFFLMSSYILCTTAARNNDSSERGRSQAVARLTKLKNTFSFLKSTNCGSAEIVSNEAETERKKEREKCKRDQAAKRNCRSRFSLRIYSGLADYLYWILKITRDMSNVVDGHQWTKVAINR